MKTRVRRLAWLLLPPVLLAAAVASTPLPPELREAGAPGSILFEDRDGGTLREVRATDGARARWLRLSEAGREPIRALLAAEDRRFYSHPGVDAIALVRAVVANVANRRVVSGASTLTMQLARIVRPHPRTLLGKVREMLLALRIECSLSKDQILEQYVNRVSFGPNLRGLAAASHAYFDKSPGSLSTAEAALLAGLPRGPSLYDVARHPDRARRRRDRILSRMRAAQWLTPEAEARAAGEPVVVRPRGAAFGAPHLVAGLVASGLRAAQPGLAEAWSAQPAVARVRTTLDGQLQRAVEAQATATIGELGSKNVSAAAVVVVENATGDVLAYLGSPDFFEPRLGQNDGVRARRQPGSTLKPFLYEVAMEKLGFDPSTALPDIELHLASEGGPDFAPHDYDGRFRGPVRLREALGDSLNVPAVWTADRLGIDALLTRLRELGFDSLDAEPAFYGPALALGDGEVTLLELARAYSTLARRGVDRPLRLVSRLENASGGQAELDPAVERRVMPQIFADLIVDVLKDHHARAASFGERTVLDFSFDVAAKTGTSKGYRDNWTLGFSSEVTVGVWVGNFGGEPMANVSGITGAGPLFHAVMEAAMRGRPAAALPLADGTTRPAGLERVEVCALSGQPAGPDCPHRLLEWRAAALDAPPCAMHVRVPIDRRSGLRAGKGCQPADVEERVFESFPPEFAAWAYASRRPVAPNEWSSECPPYSGELRSQPEGDPLAAGDYPRIDYPLPGARFVLDPDRPRELQVLDVQIVAPPSAQEVTLLVDGGVAARARLPFRIAWPLRAGGHELVATVDGRRSPAVRVAVREGSP